jgi:transcriptional regulator GlxA family with amidase domain
MQIAVYLYPGMTALDLVGPHEVLSRLPGAVIKRVAERAGPILTDSGLIMLADHGLDQIDTADILLVPGATDAWPETRKPYVLDWLRRIDATSTWTTSVCTGAIILGAAGLLKGKNATTFWSELEELRDFGAMPLSERVVEDGKLMTSAGVSAGIDLALTLTERVAGTLVAKALQLGVEYDPRPPFDSGSPEKCDPKLVEMVRSRIAQASTKSHSVEGRIATT